MATKQIIVLSQVSDGTNISYNGLFWFPISSHANPQTAGSAWVPITGVTTGALTAENTAIQNGTIKEEAWVQPFAINTPVATIESVLQQLWIARNSEIGGIGSNQYMGSYYDGTSWSQT